MTPALELRAVHKSFGRTAIINGVDLTIAKGERHAIIGPNGAGKSTLFNLISGRFPVTSGKELILVDSVVGMKTAVLALLEDDHQREAIKQAALQFVQQYDWRQVVERFNELYVALELR